MRTPAGKECKFYYEDYYRGSETEECRLIARSRESLPWNSGLCGSCPVPDILRANACPNMVLDARVVKRFFGLSQAVESAWCSEYFEDVKQPHVGCGHCHEFTGGHSILDGKVADGDS